MKMGIFSSSLAYPQLLLHFLKTCPNTINALLSILGIYHLHLKMLTGHFFLEIISPNNTLFSSHSLKYLTFSGIAYCDGDQLQFL